MMEIAIEIALAMILKVTADNVDRKLSEFPKLFTSFSSFIEMLFLCINKVVGFALPANLWCVEELNNYILLFI